MQQMLRVQNLVRWNLVETNASETDLLDYIAGILLDMITLPSAASQRGRRPSASALFGVYIRWKSIQKWSWGYLFYSFWLFFYVSLSTLGPTVSGDSRNPQNRTFWICFDIFRRVPKKLKIVLFSPFWPSARISHPTGSRQCNTRSSLDHCGHDRCHIHIWMLKHRACVAVDGQI